MCETVTENNCLESLPNEILEEILTNVSIGYRDLCRISCVSKRFKQIIDKNNEIWKCKFRQNWPNLYLLMATDSVHDWHRLCLDRHLIGRHLRQEVSKFSEIHYLDEELSNDSFQCFTDGSNYRIDSNMSEEIINLFQVSELEDILNDGSEHKNLTIKYYALKVLRFLRHESLKRQWIEYIESDSNDLFFGSLMISEWFQNKTLNKYHYRMQINLIAGLTIDEIAVRYPSNTIMKEKTETRILSDSEANRLTESKWSAKDCQQILLSLNEVLFTQLKFESNNDDFYNINNSFMDKVIDLRLGIPITYCILYYTIAAKLGVKTFPVNFPHHFILKWKQSDSTRNADCSPYTYIDVYGGGRLLNTHTKYSYSSLFTNFSQTEADALGVCSTRDMFCRMCRNLIEIGRQQENSSEGLLCLRNALELLCILSPEDTESRLLLSRVYLHLNINLEEVNEMLQKISEMDPTSIGVVMFLRQSVTSQLSAKRTNLLKGKKTCVKRRKQNVDINYAIGMIMSHKKYNYSCVIYGWDSKCAASRDWIYQMGVYNLPNKDKQPFYNVLVEDGTTRYAAQENLEPSSRPSSIRHPEIGKYFKEFAQTHYVCNEQKAIEYPDDSVALNQFLDKFKHLFNSCN